MCIHIHVHCPGLWKFFFIVTTHFLNNGRLAMYHFIMRQRQYIRFIIIVHHGKRKFMIVCGTILRCCPEIIQCIIHPSHIPLIVKSESAVTHRFCHSRIRRRILCHQHRCRKTVFQPLIHILDKRNSQIIHTSRFISLPVNQIAHRIHPQTVKMIFCQPVCCGRLQEASHFSS